jgi:ABC-2 type transport system ATP-binding protein
MVETILKVNDLRKSYTSRGKVVDAVKGINLWVNRGEIFGFLGPNGAGKTTTLRMLATLLSPDSGAAVIAGYDLLRQPGKVRTRIGYVSQAGGSDRNASAWENLIMQARLYGMRKVAARQRSEVLINAFDLSDIADRKVQTYSGGQHRRLDVALGMVHTPDLLFLDEPTTGLDPQNRSRMWKEIRRLREEGVTIFLTTHYMDEADVLSDRIAIMDMGNIVAEGTPQELKKRILGDTVVLGLGKDSMAMEKATILLRQQSFVREVNHKNGGLYLLVRDGETVLPRILRLLDGESIDLKTISLSQPTLDDVFLRETGHALQEAF